jgi:hypothetical protein
VITVAGTLLAGGWLVVALAGGATVGTVHLSPLAAAVGCGTTALACTVRPRPGLAEVLVVPVLVVGFPLAAALAVGGHTALPLLGSVLACLLAGAPRWRTTGWSLVAAEVGVGLLAAGLASGRGDLHPGVLMVEAQRGADLLAGGAAALLLAVALAPDDEDTLRVVIGPALVVGWVIAPHADAVAAGAAVLTILIAVLGAAPLARRAPAALAAAAIGLAAVGPARPAAALLAAAAVVIAAVGPSLAWPAAVPAAVAAALALSAGAATLEPVAAGVAVVVAVIWLAVAVGGGAPRPVLGPSAIPATAVAVWLGLAPASWTFAGPTRLGPYQQGVLRAVAVALLVLVVAWMTGQLRPPTPEWRSDGW